MAEVRSPQWRLGFGVHYQQKCGCVLQNVLFSSWHRILYDKEAPSHLPSRSLAMTMHGQAMKQFSFRGAQQLPYLKDAGLSLKVGCDRGSSPTTKTRATPNGLSWRQPSFLSSSPPLCRHIFHAPSNNTNHPSFIPKLKALVVGGSPWSPGLGYPLLSDRLGIRPDHGPTHLGTGPGVIPEARRNTGPFQLRRLTRQTRIYRSIERATIVGRTKISHNVRRHTDNDFQFPWLKLPHRISLSSYSTSCIVLLNPPLPHHRLSPTQ